MLCRVLRYLAAEIGDNSPANDEHAPQGTRRRHRGHLGWYAAWKECGARTREQPCYGRAYPTSRYRKQRCYSKQGRLFKFKPDTLTTVFGPPHIDLCRA